MKPLTLLLWVLVMSSSACGGKTAVVHEPPSKAKASAPTAGALMVRISTNMDTGGALLEAAGEAADNEEYKTMCAALASANDLMPKIGKDLEALTSKSDDISEADELLGVRREYVRVKDSLDGLNEYMSTASVNPCR